MKKRDCANCKHHTSDGCSSWDCEYEPKDLISRADAIEAVASITMSIHLSHVICDKLLALPSADAVSRFHHDMEIKELKHQIKDQADADWIPCSERLPSDDEYVIVSVLDDHGDTPWKYTTVAWLCNGVWISDNEILCGTAVAWMPLPKPYKGGDTE